MSTPATILVVDDDRYIVRLVESYLRQAQFTVKTAYDGQSAMHTLHRETVDLLVLDLMLPDQNGWDMTRLLRADRRLSDLPIIMLTARATDTDIGGLLREVADIFTPIAEAEGIRVTVDLAPNLPPIHADAGRVKQVMHNLLVNAFRHTSRDGTITLCARADSTAVYIEVADTGTGISPEHLAYIFERFYRADPARSRASGSTGLGLAIGKAIIEAHGGTIHVESRVALPSGTKFVILLPQSA